MPLDPFDDRATTRPRGRAARPALRIQAANVIHALLGDVFYFRWAFAALGAVIWVAAVC